MSEKVIKATSNFTRSDVRLPVRRGEIFTCSEDYAKELIKLGHAIETKMMPAPESKKTQPAGTKLSVSQAGQASQTSKSKPSSDGEKKPSATRKAKK